MSTAVPEESAGVLGDRHDAVTICRAALTVGRQLPHTHRLDGSASGSATAFSRARRRRRVDAPATGRPAPRPAAGLAWHQPGRTVVVLNPTVTNRADREALRRVLERHGHRAPVFVATTAADPGGGQAAGAVRDGAALVVVCGGDGTLRAAADALAGTGVPLALVPCGTGNLLARNLGLPLGPADALDAALGGTVHRVDLGHVEGDGLGSRHFAAMSGAGLDAAMVRWANAHDRLKSRLGWPVYALAVLRELRTPRTGVSIRLDGAPALRRTARMVLVGNIGTVQGGVTLLPAARPDDGRLDLLLLDPRGPGDWLRALWALLRPGAAAGAARSASRRPAPVEHFTFRHAEFTFDTPQPRELDGDPVSPGRRLSVTVRPAALTMLLPERGK
ncbi:diacylglycerol/lipid kinase family protein [Streptomyces pyxinicus]|uniref:diacylglycerol/lipid kinase family protein n=1 Tax=Streptomyces pyxinicus TaxID=2970331 RepID=UPI003D16B257